MALILHGLIFQESATGSGMADLPVLLAQILTKWLDAFLVEGLQ
jgi:hypothetical protein